MIFKKLFLKNKMKNHNPNRCDYEELLKTSSNYIAGNTPIPCAVDGMFDYLKIEDISEEKTWTKIDENTEVAYPKYGIFVWDGENWTKINFVVRHTKKEMKRINSHVALIDSTLDNKLLHSEGEILCSSVSKSTVLLHSEAPLPNDTPKEPQYTSFDTNDALKHELSTDAEKLAFLYGLFYVSGTCGIYKNGISYRKTWCINSSDRQLLEKAKEYLNMFEQGCDFEIHEFESGNEILYLRPVVVGERGSLSSLVDKYREMFYDNRKEKKVPSIIFNTSLTIRQAFFVGCYSSRGAVRPIGLILTESGQIGAAGLFRLLRSLGYKVSLSYTTTFRLQASTKLKKNPFLVKSVATVYPPEAIENPVLEREFRGVTPTKEGFYEYKGIKIFAERFPKQALLTSLDLAQEKNKFRGRFISFKKKKVTYKCDNCNTCITTALRILHNDKAPGHNKVCKCVPELRYNERLTLVDIPKDITDKSEHVYTLQTESLKYAAGIGTLIIHS